MSKERNETIFQVSSSRQPVAARVYMCVYVDANESRYIAEQCDAERHKGSKDGNRNRNKSKNKSKSRRSGI